ncbi:hypothetical protein KUTeg_020879 [Tegillarca granosa]|uniref:Uncharacterized protein n=1 Tax=Tegillarca granosa TaxID=220873 RepID=A0ABQ9EDD4_TEGGR|nr:hypothetical protein KUTeg_020879 [Tegillarca granosa]
MPTILHHVFTSHIFYYGVAKCLLKNYHRLIVLIVLTDLENFKPFSDKFRRRTSRLNSVKSSSLYQSNSEHTTSKRETQLRSLTKSMSSTNMFTRFKQNLNSSQLYENSYVINNDDNTVATKIKGVIEDLLDTYLKHKKYDSQTCGYLACTLSTMIKERLKNLNLRRYKFVCQVVIGQTKRQDICVSSRCLWMIETDTHQQANYSNDSLFAVVTVFAVYFE